MRTFNYHHLHYFWVVAKEGGFARAAERLDMAVQTVSAQVRALEKSLGCQLLKPDGRGVTLTEAGKVAFTKAEEIFQLGQVLTRDVQQSMQQRTIRLSVGLSDGLSKLAAHVLLGPALETPSVRLLCHEGEFEQLMAELALHQLDVVLAGEPAPANPNLRLSSQLLVSSPVAWFGPARWVTSAHCNNFPQCLASLPVLLPTGHSPLRLALDRWFDTLQLQPRVVGEFEDSALLSVFSAQGMGVFPISTLGVSDVSMVKGLKPLGTTQVHESIYAIYTQRSRHHPLVATLLNISKKAK